MDTWWDGGTVLGKGGELSLKAVLINQGMNILGNGLFGGWARLSAKLPVSGNYSTLFYRREPKGH